MPDKSWLDIMIIYSISKRLNRIRDQREEDIPQCNFISLMMMLV